MSGRNHFDRTFSINLAEFIYLFTFFESVEMIWTGNSCPVHQTQRFFLESNDKVCCMAGLLTCFCGRRLPGDVSSGLRGMCLSHFTKLTAAGLFRILT